jgi:RNA polymerase sigma-70 factor (ECF subfamily)
MPEFTEFYYANFAFVWRCLRGLGVPPRVLDDAAQEVFIAVYRSFGSFRGESSPRTWLYGIVRNVAYKQRRTLARKDRGEPLEEEPPASGRSPQDEVEDAQVTALVARFAAGLEEKKRDVFVLALLEELPVPEVAEILGVPLNTTYTRLRAVRAALREALELEGAMP